MNEFLQDEVPPGMSVQRRDRQSLAERRQVPMQITDHHDLVGIVKRDDRARAPGGRAHELGGFADGREDFLGVRHGSDPRSSGTGSTLGSRWDAWNRGFRDRFYPVNRCSRRPLQRATLDEASGTIEVSLIL